MYCKWKCKKILCIETLKGQNGKQSGLASRNTNGVYLKGLKKLREISFRIHGV
jgi:hypothetical protein